MGKDFAKYNVIGESIPLLPTELLIIIWFFYKVTTLKKGLYNYSKIVKLPLVFFFLFSTVIFLISPFNLFSLRQYIPFAYVVLIFVTYDFIRLFNNIESLYKLSIKAFIISFVVTILNIYIFKTTSGLQTSTVGVFYLYTGNFGLVFFVFFISIVNYLEGDKRYISLILLAILWILLFALHRSAILAIVIPIIFYFSSKKIFKNTARILLISFLLVSLAILFQSITKGNSSVIEGVLNRILSIFSYDEDPNSKFRINYWQDALNYISNHVEIVLYGAGFGLTKYEIQMTDFTKMDTLTSGVRAFHNSFVFIFYKTGIIVLLLYILIFIKPLRDTLKSIDKQNKIIGMSLLSMLIFSFFNVVFENPYYGFYLWFFVGLIHYLNFKNQLKYV